MPVNNLFSIAMLLQNMAIYSRTNGGPVHGMRAKRGRGRPRTKSKSKYASVKSAKAGNITKYIGFPANKVVRMRYHEVLNQPIGATQSSFFYKANGLNDPRVAAGGHQPLGHDQWNQFYNHYVVLGSKATFTITGTTNAAPLDTILLSAYISDDTTIPTDVNTLIESGRAEHTLLPAYNAMNQRQVKSMYSAKNFFNIKDIADNLTRLGAAFGAEPPELAFHSINLTNISLQGTNTEVCITVQIDYVVLLSEPIDLPTS